MDGADAKCKERLIFRIGRIFSLFLIGFPIPLSSVLFMIAISDAMSATALGAHEIISTYLDDIKISNAIGAPPEKAFEAEARLGQELALRRV